MPHALKTASLASLAFLLIACSDKAPDASTTVAKTDKALQPEHEKLRR